MHPAHLVCLPVRRDVTGSRSNGCLTELLIFPAHRPTRPSSELRVQPEAIVMAVPKKRQSKMKTRQRKANVRAPTGHERTVLTF